MKQKLYFLLLIFWIGFQSNGQTLDQSNWVTSTGTNFAIEQSINQGIVGQSFTSNLAGTLNQVKLDLNILSAGTTVDFSIYDGSGNTGNLIATLPLTFAAASFGEYTIDVSSFNITTFPGNTYTLVLSNASDILSWVYTSGDTYTNGEAYLSTGGGTFSSVSNTDLRFKTYVNPSVTPTPASNLNFDGIDDYVVLPNQNDFNFSSNAFTLEFWFKLSGSSFTGEQTFISKGNAWIVTLSNTGRISFLTGGIGVTSQTSIDEDDTNWHHCAVSFSNSTHKIYIDGNLDNERFNFGSSIPSNTTSVAIGENLENTNNFFNGSLEDVRIWNIARTNSEIQGAMNCELNGNETGLFAYYKFNTGNDGLNNNDILSLMMIQ
ncbi:MAG: LamG domain-containing protein [Flavobacterium sp.]|nr:LamG domain-containing protein [Flavobacterium sp.]